MWEGHEVLHSGWALVRGAVLVFCCCGIPEKKISRAERSALAGRGRAWHRIMVEKGRRSSWRCVDQEAEKRDGAITRIPAFLLLFHPGPQPTGGSHLH